MHFLGVFLVCMQYFRLLGFMVLELWGHTLTNTDTHWHTLTIISLDKHTCIVFAFCDPSPEHLLVINIPGLGVDSTCLAASFDGLVFSALASGLEPVSKMVVVADLQSADANFCSFPWTYGLSTPLVEWQPIRHSVTCTEDNNNTNWILKCKPFS